MPTRPLTPTALTAADHDAAYDFFNARLFGASLPRCLINVSTKRRAVGYFRPAYVTDSVLVGQPGHLDEIGMNPEYYADLREYLSTLVHEMVHLEQAHVGRPGKGGYHNRAWALRMLDLGLPPFNVNHPEKMIGVRISNIVLDGGLFDLACQELMESGFKISWVHLPEVQPQQGGPPGEDEEQGTQVRRKQQKVSKTPYECQGCGRGPNQP